MDRLPKVSKQTLLLLIDQLKEKPDDKFRILGQAGVVSVTATGAPLLSAAVITGVKSIFGLSAAAHLFGWMPALLVTGPPLVLILACASALGLCAYAFTRLIHGGGMAEGRKAELLTKFNDQVKDIKAKEQAASETEINKTQFILSLREIIDADAIPIASAFRMIELVEAGRMPLSQAVSLTKNCLETKFPRQFSR
jgi:hypothetical protein